MTIVSRAFTQGFFDVPRTDKETLAKYRDGLSLTPPQEYAAARMCPAWCEKRWQGMPFAAAMLLAAAAPARKQGIYEPSISLG